MSLTKMKQDKFSLSETKTILFKIFGLSLRATIALGIALSFILLTIISPVFFLYRSFVCHVASFSKNRGQCLTLQGQMMAADFLPGKALRSTRYSVVTCFTCGGNFPFEIAKDCVEKRWVYKRNGASGDFEFPEFQQYIESFMGYMFWNQDTTFDLNNHLHLHEINEGGSHLDSKEFLETLMEELVNKPYLPRKSPWEFHVVHNYRDVDILRKTGEDRLTLFVMRAHHAMVDGFSVINMLGDKLMGTPVAKMNSQLASSLGLNPKPKMNYWSVTKMFKSCLTTFEDFMYLADVGLEPTIKWHIPDEKKTWKLVFSKSRMIPLETIKTVKNKFGVSFTSVLLSALSYGISKKLEIDGIDFKKVRRLPFAMTLPLPNHPDGLRNHATGGMLDLPVEPQSYDSVKRLKTSENSYQRGCNSNMPKLAPLLQRVISSFPTKVTSLITYNRHLCTGWTNFAGPGLELEWEGRKILTSHFCTGILDGVAGLGFMALSYNDHMWISGVAEEGIMARFELEDIISWSLEEIDRLNQLSK